MKPLFEDPRLPPLSQPLSWSLPRATDADADPLRVSYGTVNLLPLRARPPPTPLKLPRCCWPPDCASVCRSLVFLLVHSIVAWSAGLVLWIGVLLSVVLLPLCGLGVWLFRRLFRSHAVDFCAKWDAALVNYVSSEREQIQIQLDSLDVVGNDEHDHDGRPVERLASGLDALSAESAMVLVYLTTVKLILATTGLCVAGVVLALPLLWVHSLLSDQHVLVSTSFSVWETVCAYTALGLVFAVAVMSLDLVVGLCCAATRFFCCERVYALPLPRVRATVAATRPNVVVVRLPPSATGFYGLATSSTTSTTTTSSRGL